MSTTHLLNLYDLWIVLTDYNRLSDLIPNLSSSKVISRNSERVLLKQVGSQKLFGLNFSAEVLLELFEDRNNGRLKFQLINGDFRRFEGTWKVTDISKEERLLLYELTVQGCIGMPVALIEQRLRQDLTTNLLAVEEAAFKA